MLFMVGGWGSGCRGVVELRNTQFPYVLGLVVLSRLAAASRAAAAVAAAIIVVAAALVPLHVAADAEGLAAAGEGALEGLLARVRVAVDPQRAGP